jgi:hypothetical protein
MAPRKKQTNKEEKNVIRFNVSAAPIVLKWAKQVMAARGYSNISAFVSDLIRRAKDREDEKAVLEKAQTPPFPDASSFEEPKKSDAK